MPAGETGPSKSEKAGLNFPVGRIARLLQEGKYVEGEIEEGAAIYLTAVLEYLTAEVIELAGNSAKLAKRQRIIPRNIYMSIKEDSELDALMSDPMIAGGGATLNINPFLLKHL